MTYVITMTTFDERKPQNIMIKGNEAVALGIAFMLEHDRNALEINVYRIDEENPMSIKIYEKNFYGNLK